MIPVVTATIHHPIARVRGGEDKERKKRKEGGVIEKQRTHLGENDNPKQEEGHFEKRRKRII